MDNFSRLGGTTHIGPISETVWAVHKKKKTHHRHGEERKKDLKDRGEKKQEEVKETPSTEMQEGQDARPDPENEASIGYGSFKSKTRKSRKIDLVI